MYQVTIIQRGSLTAINTPNLEAAELIRSIATAQHLRARVWWFASKGCPALIG